jgi:hypothetical protein
MNKSTSKSKFSSTGSTESSDDNTDTNTNMNLNMNTSVDTDNNTNKNENCNDNNNDNPLMNKWKELKFVSSRSASSEKQLSSISTSTSDNGSGCSCDSGSSIGSSSDNAYLPSLLFSSIQNNHLNNDNIMQSIIHNKENATISTSTRRTDHTNHLQSWCDYHELKSDFVIHNMDDLFKYLIHEPEQIFI